MSTKENKNNFDFIKELVHLLKENNLSQLEIEKHSKDSETLIIKMAQSTDSYLTPEITSSENKRIITTPDENENILNEETQEKTSNVKINTPLNHPGLLNSPMVGTIYLAPEPGAEPFVKVGDSVKIGQTILIIEAMKTLNQIPAVKSGVLKTIFVEDGSPVEFGSPLAIIE